MLELPNDTKASSSPVSMKDWTSNDSIRNLFASLVDATSEVELVEMVDRHTGQPAASRDWYVCHQG
jgi:hypothetical protein